LEVEKMTIECNDEQAFLMEVALDIVSRISMGQVTELYRIFELNATNFLEFRCSDGETRGGYCLGDYFSKVIKPVIFPELADGASYGVGNKKFPQSQKMYEMVKILQNYRARKENHPENMVTHSPPLNYSGTKFINIKD
jgi:hypothetical protein